MFIQKFGNVGKVNFYTERQFNSDDEIKEYAREKLREKNYTGTIKKVYVNDMLVLENVTIS